MYRWFKIITAIVGLALLLGIAGMTAEEEPKYGGELVWAFEVEPPNLDPHKWAGTAATTVLTVIYNSLYRFDREGRMVPDLAADYIEVLAPTLFRIRLRDDVYFHNGDKFSAEDVKASIERIQDPKTGAEWRKQLLNIKEVEIESNTSVLFHLAQPMSPELLTEILARPQTAMLSKKWLEAGPDFENAPVGTGPFKFVQRRYGIDILVERNEHYFKKGLPYLDRIRFVIYPDEDLRTAALVTGAIDVNLYTPWKDLDAMMENPEIEVVKVVGAIMDITFNVGVPPFDNKLVRQAVAYAVPRGAIVSAAFWGHGTEIWGGLLWFDEKHWAYYPGNKRYFKYDPDKAKELLAQAGYPNCFEATILASADHHMHYVTAEIVQASLAALGCTIHVDLEEWATRVARGNAEDYQFAINGKSPHLVDPDWFTTYYYSGMAGYYHRPAHYNFPELDAILDEARRTLDREKRAALYAEWETKFLEESPAIWLVWRDQGSSYRKGVVHNFAVLSGGRWDVSGQLIETMWVTK